MARPEFGRGCSSGVEHDLAKVGVEGSNPFARSKSHNKSKGWLRLQGGIDCHFGPAEADARKIRVRPSSFPVPSNLLVSPDWQIRVQIIKPKRARHSPIRKGNTFFVVVFPASAFAGAIAPRQGMKVSL